jgi:hypothetical protein
LVETVAAKKWLVSSASVKVIFPLKVRVCFNKSVRFCRVFVSVYPLVSRTTMFLKFKLVRPDCPFTPGLSSIEKVLPFFSKACRNKKLLDARYPLVLVCVLLSRLETGSRRLLMVPGFGNNAGS